VISNGIACWIGGLSLIALTIGMHSIALAYIALLLVRLRKWGLNSNLGHRSTVRFVVLVLALAGATLAALHATEAIVWGITYLWIGAMGSWLDAVLYSIDSMTTRGASGLHLAEEWRLMGALEAADGMLLFGISTAFVFAVLQHLWPMLTGAESAKCQATAVRSARNRGQ
jgi:hypothetical protein